MCIYKNKTTKPMEGWPSNNSESLILSLLQLALLETLGILGYDELIDNILNVTIHKC